MSTKAKYRQFASIACATALGIGIAGLGSANATQVASPRTEAIAKQYAQSTNAWAAPVQTRIEGDSLVLGPLAGNRYAQVDAATLKVESYQDYEPGQIPLANGDVASWSVETEQCPWTGCPDGVVDDESTLVLGVTKRTGARSEARIKLGTDLYEGETFPILPDAVTFTGPNTAVAVLASERVIRSPGGSPSCTLEPLVQIIDIASSQVTASTRLGAVECYVGAASITPLESGYAVVLCAEDFFTDGRRICHSAPSDIRILDRALNEKFQIAPGYAPDKEYEWVYNAPPEHLMGPSAVTMTEAGGSLYVVGHTQMLPSNLTPPKGLWTFGRAAFASKVDLSTGQILWTERLSGKLDDIATSVTIDPKTGQILVGGLTSGALPGNPEYQDKYEFNTDETGQACNRPESDFKSGDWDGFLWQLSPEGQTISVEQFGRKLYWRCGALLSEKSTTVALSAGSQPALFLEVSSLGTNPTESYDSTNVVASSVPGEFEHEIALPDWYRPGMVLAADKKSLPARTTGNVPVTWQNQTPRTCTIHSGFGGSNFVSFPFSRVWPTETAGECVITGTAQDSPRFEQAQPVRLTFKNTRSTPSAVSLSIEVSRIQTSYGPRLQVVGKSSGLKGGTLVRVMVKTSGSSEFRNAAAAKVTSNGSFKVRIKVSGKAAVRAQTSDGARSPVVRVG